ncbi:hypothetical protein GIB67_022438 [Kingdonia uniflora]|uniref:PPM-type phosphatase domain-containing protein n=1 Tax=Kingdonia uniflora TaxID=39325 RepID=A0A7J7MUJ8_9MAGN|nr:hypothetical protein GIB67_022438 [Kingdonia uniflora]
MSHKREGDFDNTHLISKKSKPSNDKPIGELSDNSQTNHQSHLIGEKSQIETSNLAPDVQPSSVDTNKGDLHCIIEADAAEDKGSRHTMEDRWVVLEDASLGFPGNLRCSHFAIYDGHGGRLAAEFAQKHLHANVCSAGLPRELMDVKAAKKAILDGMIKLS